MQGLSVRQEVTDNLFSNVDVETASCMLEPGVT